MKKNFKNILIKKKNFCIMNIKKNNYKKLDIIMKVLFIEQESLLIYQTIKVY